MSTFSTESSDDSAAPADAEDVTADSAPADELDAAADPVSALGGVGPLAADVADDDPDVIDQTPADLPIGTDLDDPVEAPAEDEPAAASDAPGDELDAAPADENGDGDDADKRRRRPRRKDSPYDRPGAWFVVHTQSGYEKKVRQNVLARIQSMNMEDLIYEVVIPMEDVMEFKGGKKVVVQKKMFPGYLLVRCELSDDSWYVIRNTPGVTGFVGQGAKPSPLPRRDVESFLSEPDEDESSDQPQRKTRSRIGFEINETVRVKEGAFADFTGEIVEINEDQARLKVLVNIFGRETPVELSFGEVGKL